MSTFGACRGSPRRHNGLTGGFPHQQTIVEIPSYFVEEFIEYYPSAKFILTERDLTAWDKSLSHLVNTVVAATHSFPLNAVAIVDKHISMFTELNDTFWQVIFHGRGLKAGMPLAKADNVNE